MLTELKEQSCFQNGKSESASKTKQSPKITKQVLRVAGAIREEAVIAEDSLELEAKTATVHSEAVPSDLEVVGDIAEEEADDSAAEADVGGGLVRSGCECV